MTDFQITILGNNSAIPRYGRHPSAQYLKIGNTAILVDCGEGTQLRIEENQNTNLFAIEHIFISHLHGDHFFGLVGLLSTLGLLGRCRPLYLYAHPDLWSVIELQFKVMGLRAFQYPVHFQPLTYDGLEIICEEEGFTVASFPLVHRIPCCGFRFREIITKRKVNQQALLSYDIPKTSWSAIQKGADYTLPSGQIIPNEELVEQPPQPRTYVYASDTVYTESIVPYLERCDTAYIETTYIEQEKELAAQRYHCTAKQAASLAKQAKVGRLLIGHFSSRYKDLNLFLEESRSVFPQTEIAEEGKTFTIELW